MHTDILILGAGIGGYETFRTLQKELKKRKIQKKITLVDKEAFFTFIPLLHEVATGSVLPMHASIPLRELVTTNQGHEFLQTEVLNVDPDTKTVRTTAGEITYEYCVMALGSKTNFYNVPGANTYAREIRSLRSATALQSELFSLFETTDNISIVIVGGGYTGIELAGQLGDIKQHELKRLYPKKNLSITLLQSGDDILPNAPKKARVIARTRLEAYEITVRTNTTVTGVEKEAVLLGTGERTVSNLTIWSTGFAQIAPSFLPETLCERGRVPTDQSLRHRNYRSLYAVGDIACFSNPGESEPVPQLGEVAHVAGQYVGLHLAKTIAGFTMNEFGFRQHLSLMPIGDWFGIMILWNKYVFTGRLAWWLRRTAYVLFMPGITRKLRIVFDWTMQSFGWRHTIPYDLSDSKKK